MKNLLSAFLILTILAVFAASFFRLSVPSQKQMIFVLRPEAAKILSARRRSCLPLPGSNQVEGRIVWPADVNFTRWYSHAFRKIGARIIEVDRESVTAVARTREGGTVQIRAELRGRIVFYHLTFK